MTTADRSRLRFIYVTRHLNRSGFEALKACIDAGYRPQAVVVAAARPLLARRWLRSWVIAAYRTKCWFYRCPPLRMLLSEEILAREHNIPIIAVDTLKENGAVYDAAGTMDLMVVAGGWHERIPIRLLQLPRYGSINVHPSLLPEFRGTSITRWQIAESAEVSGVTIHYMDATLDTGPVIAQRWHQISRNIPPQLLFQELAQTAAPLLIDVLDRFASGEKPEIISRTPDPRFDRYYTRWRWNAAALAIDPQAPLHCIHHQVLAATQESYDFPGPRLRLGDREFFIRQTELIDVNNERWFAEAEDPTLLRVHGDSLVWNRSGESVQLRIVMIQPCSQCFRWCRANRPRHWFSEGSIVRAGPVIKHPALAAFAN